MYNDTVTLFNRTPDRQWIPTVLHGVNLNTDRSAIVAKYGEKSTDAAVLNVKYSVKDGQVIVADNPWQPPKAWQGDGITFASGNDFDFFWHGEWTEGIVDDRSYTGGFYQYMNKTYDFVFAVTGFSRFSVIPHFEVTGR